MAEIPRLTQFEWGKLVDEILELWTPSKAWEQAHLKHWPRFQWFTEDEIRKAIDELYSEGRQSTPAPSVVFSACKKLARDRQKQIAKAREGEHRHVWSIWEYEDDRDDGQRLLVCAVGADCGYTEKLVPAGVRGHGGLNEEEVAALERERETPEPPEIDDRW